MFRRVDGRGFRCYKRLLSGKIIEYDLFSLRVTRVQSDPYAPPSFIEVLLEKHGFPERFFRDDNRVPFTDYLARRLYSLTRRYSRKCGSGYSCYIGIPRSGPWILYRSCVETIDNNIILRFYLGLPARGRRILGERARALFIDIIPRIIKGIIDLRERLDGIDEHIALYHDQEYIRDWLWRNGYVAFIGDGSILPRESSISYEPMENAVPFKSPEELRVRIDLPSGRTVYGMALPRGIVVVTGGGYHGKSTLLNSIQEGIYDHVAGDGREYVISLKDTIYVRAEDGRIISCVDISSFIEELPSGTDTRCFSTLNASGSTSMAASINEAIEAGARLILIDEDTSATNLLYKDPYMEKIIYNEPIKTLLKQARDLYRKTGTSIVIVLSASSMFMRVSDRVILMDKYVPYDITDRIKGILEGEHVTSIQYRIPRKRMFKGIVGLKKVKAKGYRLSIEYTDNTRFELDLSSNPRIVERGQVKLIAYTIKNVCRKVSGIGVRELIKYINSLYRERSFSGVVYPVPPDLTMVDGFDIIWVLNRLYKSLFVI